MEEIKTLVLDVDGVLTDGKLYMGAGGEKMFKAFHTRHVRAIREFIARGFEVVLITADAWPGIKCFAEKVGAELIVERNKSTIVAGINGPFMMVGDDVWDASLMKLAEYLFAPRNCDQALKMLDGIEILDINGGDGVVAELLNRLIITNRLCVLS